MREVSQTEAIQTLPALLKEAQSDTICIEAEDGSQAFIISAQKYQHVRKAAIREMMKISRRATVKVKEHAAELGITPEELVADLLKR